MERGFENVQPTHPATNREVPGAEWDDTEKEFQYRWIQHVCAIDLEKSGNTEEVVIDQAANDAMVELVGVYGQWLRENILTTEKRSYFLGLYTEDADRAFSEIDALFAGRTQ